MFQTKHYTFHILEYFLKPFLIFFEQYIGIKHANLVNMMITILHFHLEIGISFESVRNTADREVSMTLGGKTQVVFQVKACQEANIKLEAYPGNAFEKYF